MPKEKPPRFPVGLTIDRAIALGWKPGRGRPLIAGDDGVIREVTPNDTAWINPINQPSLCTYSFDRPPKWRQRTGGSGIRAVRKSIRDTMARWRAAERERKRRRRKRSAETISKVLALPAPTNDALTSSAPLNAQIEIMSKHTANSATTEQVAEVPPGSVTVNLIFAPSGIDMLRRLGYLAVDATSPRDVEQGAVMMIMRAAWSAAVRCSAHQEGVCAKPVPLPPAAEASAPAADIEELVDEPDARKRGRVVSRRMGKGPRA
jgi:hypothetical protein